MSNRSRSSARCPRRRPGEAKAKAVIPCRAASSTSSAACERTCRSVAGGRCAGSASCWLTSVSLPVTGSAWRAPLTASLPGAGQTYPTNVEGRAYAWQRPAWTPAFSIHLDISGSPVAPVTQRRRETIPSPEPGTGGVRRKRASANADRRSRAISVPSSVRNWVRWSWRRIPLLSTRIQRPAELTAAGLLTRDRAGAYLLTDLGAALAPALESLDSWARRWAEVLQETDRTT